MGRSYGLDFVIPVLEDQLRLSIQQMRLNGRCHALGNSLCSANGKFKAC
jgi:hypothetical protein